MGDQKDELPNHFNKMPIDGWDEKKDKGKKNQTFAEFSLWIGAQHGKKWEGAGVTRNVR